MMTRKEMEAQWQRRNLICATHFNWWGWREEEDDTHGFAKGGYFCWHKKPWDEHHKGTHEKDPAHEEE